MLCVYICYMVELQITFCSSRSVLPCHGELLQSILVSHGLEMMAHHRSHAKTRKQTMHPADLARRRKLVRVLYKELLHSILVLKIL